MTVGLLDRIFARDRQEARCSVVIAAAGVSARMGGENKLLLPLGGVPVLVRSIMAFEQTPAVKEIVVATREEDIVAVADLCKAYELTKVAKVIQGGPTRVETVLAAVMECDRDCGLIAVHDGARPLVTTELIDRVIACAKKSSAAAPAIPVKDTIKEAEGSVVLSTLDRSRLRAMQTPQIFDADLLRAALQSAVNSGIAITDDCYAVERTGKVVALTEGEESNIKITTPIDLVLAEAILREKEDIFG